MATDTHEHLDWGAHARRELARAGHRAGGAREQVLSLLERQPCCLSAQEIHDRLRTTDARTPGLASVYRALEVLTALRLVHRLDVDGTACFERADPSGEHHHHAICERCGKRDVFEDPELEPLIVAAARIVCSSAGHPDRVLTAMPDVLPRPEASSPASPRSGLDRASPSWAVGTLRHAPKRSFRELPVLRSPCPSTVSPAAKR
jgi:Fur family ferric uptake transcriptional regulator